MLTFADQVFLWFGSVMCVSYAFHCLALALLSKDVLLQRETLKIEGWFSTEQALIAHRIVESVWFVLFVWIAWRLHQ